MHPPVALLLHPAALIAFTEFTVHPSTVIGLAGLGALYHWRSRHEVRSRHDVRDDTSASQGPSTAQRACFYGALVLLFLFGKLSSRTGALL